MPKMKGAKPQTLRRRKKLSVSDELDQLIAEKARLGYCPRCRPFANERNGCSKWCGGHRWQEGPARGRQIATQKMPLRTRRAASREVV